ncbi:MAG: polysaccharide deacetylase family protein [Blastocatellia bacterium]|nr:polysaccharide deacetylase family protein [Blastocatellia bacterium]
MIKGVILNVMRATGWFDLLRYAHRRQPLILTYHRFSDGDDPDKTSAAAFAEQLDYLTAHYDVVPLGRLVSEMNAGQPRARSGKGMAAITIDDGYRDTYEIAYPLLRKRSLPAMSYVVTEFADRHCWIWTDKARYLCARANPQWLTTRIGGHESWLELGDEASRRRTALRLNDLLKKLPEEAKESALERLAETLEVPLPRTPPEHLRSITWEQAREMDQNGVEIGSHTRTHPILTNITEEQLRRELYESRLRLEEELGRPVEHFCYPNGDNDARVQREVARAGYRVAVTTVSGLNRRGDDPLTLHRIHTEHDLAHFLQSTCGFEQLKNRARTLINRSAASDSILAMQGANQNR